MCKTTQTFKLMSYFKLENCFSEKPELEELYEVREVKEDGHTWLLLRRKAFRCIQFSKLVHTTGFFSSYKLLRVAVKLMCNVWLVKWSLTSICTFISRSLIFWSLPFAISTILWLCKIFFFFCYVKMSNKTQQQAARFEISFMSVIGGWVMREM